MSKIGAIERWRAWAGSLSNRHRRLGARTAGLTSVLAKPRTAGRTVREHWIHSTRTLQPRVHLSIQPLLHFDFRPTVATVASPRVFRQVLHETERRSSESHRIVDRFRQAGSSTFRVLGTSPPGPIPETPRIAPLSLVLQRLREPERALAAQTERRAQKGPESRPATARHLARHLASKLRREERPADTQADRVLREDAQASRNDRDPAGAARSFPTMAPRTAPDLWRETPTATAAPTAAAMVASPSVEVLTEKVMHQIDQRLHAWRERRGGF
jgi:hypothetical protein